MGIRKEIDLTNLPSIRHGSRTRIKWSETIGYKCDFKYGDIESFVYIKEYNKNTKKLTIEYNGLEFKILYATFSKCNFGEILKKNTKSFKIKVGQTFEEAKRNFKIIDREYRLKEKIDSKSNSTYLYNQKYYKYHCNKCGAELWMIENDLLRGNGCACCKGLTVVRGINDISTTNPKMTKYFKNVGDVYTHTYYSNEKVIMKCPDCETEREMKIGYLYNYGFSCPVCNDGISYPEKLMGSVLKQLKIDFKTQLSKTTFKWCNQYRYDFYFNLNDEEYIIETHGKQHYKESGFKMSLEEVQENDRIKKELALKNNIKEENYIIIDCRKSELEFIKNNIIHSKLNKIFDLNTIDWIEIDKKSQNNLVKEVCDYWNLHNNINNENLTINEIGDIFYLDRHTSSKYLKIGNKLKWCTYDKNKEKQVEIFKNGKSLGVFKSISDLERKSKELIGEELHHGNISYSCRNNKSYKGFTFKYVESEKVS